VVFINYFFGSLFSSSSQDFEFERPVETAALFSLIGAGCIVTNQWYTTVQENVQLMNTLLGGKLMLC